MADSSFDVVSKVDRQEADNALNQAAKELSHPVRLPRHRHLHRMAGRGDRGNHVLHRGAREGRHRRLQGKTHPPRHLDEGVRVSGDPQSSGKTYKVSGTIKQGISSEDAKKITKIIRDEGPKGVKAQIQGDEVRVSSKKRDDLQAVQACCKKARPRGRVAVRQLPLTRLSGDVRVAASPMNRRSSARSSSAAPS